MNDRFQQEMLSLMKSVVIKISENSKEIALLRKDINSNTKELESLKKVIRSNFGLDNDLQFRVIEMVNRLFDVEKQIKLFVNNFSDLEEEYKRIFSELLELSATIDNNSDARAQLDELTVWLENLEEKVFN
jgi:uncharacterized membrane protein YgaE (UPF0421/DUF939 family)